jgi:hypothetical protein
MGAANNCVTHPDVAARFQCDGCGKLLCDGCIEESHRLLLCRLCGERALPLAADAPATSVERQKSAIPAAAGPYGLGQALLYPFRGSGLLLFIVSMITAAVVGFLVKYSLFGCMALVLAIGWWSLLVGIQFKIVASTAKWENELPDWPEYFSFGERVVEILTFIAIALLNWGPLAAFVVLYFADRLKDPARLLAEPPGLFFWVGAAAAVWIGIALSVMAWGGAAIHWRHSALRVDHHVKALLATGGDGLKTVNLTFVLVGIVALTQAATEALPLLGAILGLALGIYWNFLAPHLVGLLFRRHATTLHAIYEG